MFLREFETISYALFWRGDWGGWGGGLGGWQTECIMRDFEGCRRFAISWFHLVFKWNIASLLLNLSFFMQI